MSSSCLIRDLPTEERPREKLQSFGAKSLSDAELLALLFGTGRAGVSVVDMARELIGEYGSLVEMSRADSASLEQTKGIGPAKSAQLRAIFELGGRLARDRFKDQPIESPGDVCALLGPEMRALHQESVRVLLLTQRRQLIKQTEVFKGTRNECFACPAELLKPAVVHGAVSVVMVHNHPSGDPSPSSADLRATKRLNSACELMGIQLADHVIIGSITQTFPDGYYSFRESGIL